MSLGRDLIKLADLQLQLFTLDVRQFWQEAKVSVVYLVLGGVFALGAIPVLLMGLATSAAELFDWPAEWVQVILGAGVIVLATWSIQSAIKSMTSAGKALKRSQDELHKNLEWMREILNREESIDAK